MALFRAVCNIVDRRAARSRNSTSISISNSVDETLGREERLQQAALRTVDRIDQEHYLEEAPEDGREDPVFFFSAADHSEFIQRLESAGFCTYGTRYYHPITQVQLWQALVRAQGTEEAHFVIVLWRRRGSTELVAHIERI